MRFAKCKISLQWSNCSSLDIFFLSPYHYFPAFLLFNITLLVFTFQEFFQPLLNYWIFNKALHMQMPQYIKTAHHLLAKDPWHDPQKISHFSNQFLTKPTIKLQIIQQNSLLDQASRVFHSEQMLGMEPYPSHSLQTVDLLLFMQHSL